MTTLRELLVDLNRLAETEANLDLPVYGTVGSSGVSCKVSTPCLSFCNEWSDGDTLELDAGAPYIDLYLGN